MYKILKSMIQSNFAHINKTKKETIVEHNELCLKYFEKFEKELSNVLGGAY